MSFAAATAAAAAAFLAYLNYCCSAKICYCCSASGKLNRSTPLYSIDMDLLRFDSSCSDEICRFYSSIISAWFSKSMRSFMFSSCKLSDCWLRARIAERPLETSVSIFTAWSCFAAFLSFSTRPKSWDMGDLGSVLAELRLSSSGCSLSMLCC